MSKATKRKHVTKEVLDEFILPTENQQVVRVCGILTIHLWNALKIQYFFVTVDKLLIFINSSGNCGKGK